MIKYLRNLFKKSSEPVVSKQQKIIIFAGAGLSAESGLSTFRDSNGLWENHDLNIVCNIRNFIKHRDEVFDFYNARKQDILNAKPNSAHREIAKIQEAYGVENVSVFTSNIDDLLERAGVKNVCHVHGDIESMTCIDCSAVWYIGRAKYNVKELCPDCNSQKVKPNVVFFHERAPKYRDFNIAFESSGIIVGDYLLPNIKVIIGTSFTVLPLEVFKPSRSHTIIVDPNPDMAKTSEYRNSVKKIITAKASIGVKEAHIYIESIYKKR